MSSSSPLGFGACGFGSAGLGFGTPAATNSTTAALLIQSDGPGVGTPGDCVKLDTVTGDYVLDAQGNKVGWDSLSQRVYLALRTALGSAAVQTMGIKMPRGVITDNIKAQIGNAVRLALAPLTSANLLTIASIVINRVGTNALSTEVAWRAVGAPPGTPNTVTTIGPRQANPFA